MNAFFKGLAVIAVAFAASTPLMGYSCATTGGVTPESSVYLLCKSISDAEFALRPFADQMTLEQRNIVSQTVANSSVLCTQPVGALNDPVAISNQLRQQLRQLLLTKKEIST